MMEMTNKIITIGYTYAKRRLKEPLDIFCKFSHIGRIIAWIPSRLAWTPELQGRDRYLIWNIPPKEYAGTNNK